MMTQPVPNPPIDAGQSIGRPKTISDAYLDRLQELASHSPRQFGYPFERWTAQWLRRRMAEEFDVIVSERHILRLLKQMGLSTRSTAQQQPLNQRLSSQIRSASPRSPKITIYDLNPELKLE